jgi:hypothetical protein
VAEDEAAGSRVILRELIAADEDEFLGLARASVGLPQRQRCSIGVAMTTAMFHRCGGEDLEAASGSESRGREFGKWRG